MLKITIDNEEVVSNKDFTIEEEMLNTSSVILNNVYPKTWENDKDYTSNFYHPNDYSKCLITDETDYPAEAGNQVNGTSFSINVDTSKQYDFTEYDGQTSQASTPTPTSPVPVITATGRQDVVVCGKNLLPNANGTETINGITFTKNNDGSITLSNTSTAVADYYLVGASNQYINLGLETGTYNLNGVSGGSGTTYMLYCVQNRNGTLSYYQSTGTSGLNISIQSGDTFRIFIRVLSGKTVNTTIYPQLELGNTATTYEAYNGNTYEINLGKNLFDGVIEQGNYDGSTGNKTGSNAFYRNANKIPVQPNTTYTFSLNGVSQRYVILFYKGDGTFISQNSSYSTGTFTTLSNAYYVNFRCFQSDYTDSYATLPIMLEAGSQATSYAPYKTPIELCKIGNYKDIIFKNTTDNVNYDSNFATNKWLLKKAIKKVVYDSSQITDMSWLNYQNLTYFRIPKDQDSIDYNNYNSSNALFNKYANTNEQLGWDNANYIGKITSRANLIYYWIGVDKNTDLATYRTTVNNIEAYIPLATPTTTEITDTELISQLEGITLINGLNNVGINTPNLPLIMYLHYNYVNAHTDIDLLFCGVVKNSGYISLNPRDPHYQTLQVLDFKTFLSEGETLDFVIADKTIEEAIDQVISTIAPYGFIKGNIQIIGADTTIGAYSTKDKTAYDVFNYLADITQSRWTTRLIDENTVAIDFYDPTLLPEGQAIDYTPTYFENNLIDDMSYSYGSNDYRNKQVMTSSQVVGSLEQTQLLYANGYQTQFLTEMPIASLTSITVDGSTKTFATNDEKELGVEADFYYTIGSNIVESETTYSTGNEVEIGYLPIVEGRQIITNNDEIQRVSTSTGRKGVVARYETRNDATTSMELQLIGQSYIKYKGTPEIKLTIQTRSNLWNVGDRVQFNAPITELNTDYMVKSKKTNYITTIDTLFYTFELTSSFNMEQDINYFDNQRAKAKGNIGEGDYISRNVDLENTANVIFYDSVVAEATVVGDNKLNAVLNAPLNN